MHVFLLDIDLGATWECSVFTDTTREFPKWLDQFTLPPSFCDRSHRSKFSQILEIASHFNFSHSGGGVVITHCDFNLYVSWLFVMSASWLCVLKCWYAFQSDHGSCLFPIFLLGYMCFSYRLVDGLDMSSWSNGYVASIFFLWLAFSLSKWCCCMDRTETVHLNAARPIRVFLFLSCLRRVLPPWGHQDLLLYYLLAALHFPFRLIHLELSFYAVWYRGLESVFSYWHPTDGIVYWKPHPFSTELQRHLCHKSRDHTYVWFGTFCFQSLFTTPLGCLCILGLKFNLSLNIWDGKSFHLTLFQNYFEPIVRLFHFHINFRINIVKLWKKPVGIEMDFNLHISLEKWVAIHIISQSRNIIHCSTYFGLLIFFSVVFHSFPCRDLTHHLSDLFLDI